MRIDTEKNCLVMIDVQEKLTAVMNEAEAMVKNCGILIQAAKLLGMPIVWCQQAPRALGETVEPLKGLLEGITPIDKTHFSCFGDSVFKEVIEKSGAETAILCGIETHVCVYQTAADLFTAGLNVHVAADAVTSRTQENKQIALSRMATEGIVVNSTEMLLFELLRDAKHPQFKTIAGLIK